MIHAQSMKVVNICPPAAKHDAEGATSNAFDTMGFDYCNVFVTLGDTDIAMTALKVRESNGVSGSDLDGSAADVTGLIYGTSTNTGGSTSSLPGAGSDNLVFGFDIDLKNRKRYLQVVITCGDGSTGTFVSAIALLSRAEQSPVTAAQRGLSQCLRV